MKDLEPIDRWFGHAVKDGVLVISIQLAEEAELFDNPDHVTDEILQAYNTVTASLQNRSCVVVTKTQAATSQLIRILYRLYRECQKNHGNLYVCEFPQEYMISLSTLGLTELPGFRLRATEVDAVSDAQADNQKMD
jgi:hypothetical protein